MKKETGYASIDMPWLKHYPEGVYLDITSDINVSMFEFMKNKNSDYRESLALKYFGDNITYDILLKKIDEYSRILKSYGIEKGDVVSICMPNTPETIYLMYAINKIGAVANMIEPRQSTNNILNFINGSNSKILFTILDACQSKINPIMDKLMIENVVYIRLTDSITDRTDPLITESLKSTELPIIDSLFSNSRFVSLQDFSKKNFSLEEAQVEYDEELPATIIYTSGTTGMPKGAMLPSKAYNCMHNQLQYIADFKRGDTFLGAIPFFSAYGSSCGMHNSLCSGQPIILIPKFNPNNADELIIKHKPNVSFLVPNYWDNLASSSKTQKEDFSYLHICVAGGDKYPVANLNNTNEFLSNHDCNRRIRVGYGETELAGACAVMPENEFYVPGSAGIILPSCKAIVINPETQEECKYNELGEICFSSPTMMLGYHQNNEETEKITFIYNGEKYYRTGDEGYIDSDGIVTVVDRYKRSIMRPDGHTVHAAPIEEVILNIPTIEDCCVVGVKKSGLGGAIPTAFVKIKENVIVDEDFFKKVDDYCLTFLAERERALVYVVVNELPYNTMGKVEYKKLANSVLEDLDIIIVDNTFFEDKKTTSKKAPVLSLEDKK